MVLMKSYSAAKDAEAVEKLTRRSSPIPADVDAKARAICDDVRTRGDAAVREYTERFEIFEEAYRQGRPWLF